MMIDKKAFSEAAQDTDAFASEYGLEEWIRSNDIDEEAMVWVLQQRALRAAMIIDGIDPRTMSRTESTEVSLRPETEALLPVLQAAVLDGIALGLTVRGRDYGRGKKTRG
jgi:hypothetical protein